MWLRVAEFELRQQLRSHAFWIVFAISIAMVVGAFTIEALRVSWIHSSGAGAAAVTRTHLLWSLFYLFTAAAFIGDAVLRDDLTGFAPIIRTTPLSRRDYIFGRFLGAFAAVVLCFLSVPAGLLVGAPDASSYAFSFFVLALPNLFLSSAIFFGLATASRSMMGTYLGAIALLATYGAGFGGGNPLLEPFGFTAVEQGTQSAVPELCDTLLANRLLWVGIGLVILAASYALWVRGDRRIARVSASPSAGDEPAPDLAPLAAPAFGSGTAVAQFIARTGLELRQLLLTPAFAILLILGIAHAAATLWSAPAVTRGTPQTIRLLIETFQLVPVVVAIFFAGELMWNERGHRVHEIIAAAPVPTSAFMLPKLLALGLVFLGLAVATTAAAIAIQILRGSPVDLGSYLTLYIVPKTSDWLLLGVLALFLQAASPGKLAGWGWIVIYLIVSLGLEQAGFRNPLYRYGSYPGAPFPEGLSGATGTVPYRIYWGAVAALLVLLAIRLSGRGLDAPLSDRLKRHRWSTGT